MSSGSPRSRIDQFFSSRKRRPQSGKDEKSERDARRTLEGSPSAKGNLDGFLVKSPDAGAQATRPHTPVKRNLTREISFTSEAARNLDLPPDKTAANAIESCDVGIAARAPENEPSSQTNGGNMELRRFAADFLSLYCSELPPAVNFHGEQEVKGQKRNGSPSLLVACSKTCGKKQCVTEVADDSSAQGSETVKSEKNFKSGEPHESGDKAHEENDVQGIALMGLRRCTSTLNPNLIKMGVSTPGSSANTTCIIEVPKSASRSSMFSPGEEFWNEAFQVADGLYDPADKLSNKKLLTDKLTITAPQGARDVSSSFGNDSEAHDLELDGHAKPINPIKETEILPPVVQDKKASDVGQVPKESASPLPVKHFDFAQEYCSRINVINSRGCVIKKAEAVTNAESALADSSLVNQKHEQSSNCQDQTHRQSFSEKVNYSSNMALDIKPGDPSISPRKLSQIVEHASGIAVVEGNVVSLTRPDGINHMHNDRKLPDGLPVVGCGTLHVGEENKKISVSLNYEEPSTPSSSMPLKDRLQLTSWLPSEISSIYMKKGISKIYPWQVDCLLVNGVLDKRNLVYCASTSAGKSFVAEILMLRRIISTGKIALLVLPYVSICAEKAEHLEVLLEPLGKHVRSFYGNQGGGSLPKDTSVAVCTIEKANSLLNRLLEEGRLSEVGIIVIDELHMVGDQHRGYLLELMLTKLRYAAGEGNSESCSGESSGTSSGKADPANGLQIVGMSATMPNITSVADWLQAALYQTDFRPVPLEEYIKVGNTIFDKKMEVVRMISKTADLGGKDPDHIVELCNEVVQEGHSVLLFCSSRKGCESTARHISKFLKKFSIGTRDVACEFHDASSAIEALRRCPAGLDPILEESLPSGVAYHHAGLTVEEREIIETCYRKGVVRVLTATSTLAAGVNLPARRVIFRQPRVGRDFIDGTRYRQMSGRAGRTGIDTKGESILICKADEVRRINAILNDSCPPLQSCLSEDKNGMTHAILEVVAGGIVQTASDVHRYVRCTLLNSTKPFQDVVKSAQDSLRWLCHKKFLEWNEETKLYSTTSLGRASFGSSLTPEESLVVLEDLSKAREGFVLASDLHLVYLVTPINVDVEPDWELYYERFMQLSALDQSVGNRVGVMEPFLMRMAHGAPMPVQDRFKGKRSGVHERLQKRTVADDNNLMNEQTVRVSKRFYVALMLSRLVQEVPVADVCEAFKVARGMIQALQENAGRFASMVSLFCERLGWHDLEGLVSKFQNRVSFGVRAEIVELTTIPFVKGSRARALYKSGLRTPLTIAEASTSEIAKALFEKSAWAGQDGAAVRRMQMGIAKKIKNGARKIILDQAEEARLAAFSAFKSLGVHVPNFSRPVLSNIPEDSVTRGDSMTSSLEGSASPSDSKGNEKENEVAASPAADNKKMDLDDTSRFVLKGKSPETRSVTVDTVGEVNRARPMQHDCNGTDAGLLAEASSAMTIPKGGTGTPGVQGVQEVPARYDNADVELGHDHSKGDIGGEIKSNVSNGNNLDKGPINASGFPGGFDSFLEKWAAVDEFYFDLHFLKRSEPHPSILFEIFGLAICWENSPVYYVNISKDLFTSKKLSNCEDVTSSSTADTTSGLDVAKVRWNRIAEIMGRNSTRKLTWNLKIQIQVLKFPCISIPRSRKFGIEQIKMNGLELIDSSYILLPSTHVYDGIDICVVAWILWPDEESKSPPNLEKVVKKRLSTGVAATANRDGRWRNQMHKAAHNGCCRRVAQTRALGCVLWKLLVSENLVEALTKIESPLIKVLADMELCGIGVDMEACLHARHILVRKLKELEKEAYTLAGMTFSLYTAADIANVLYTRLQLTLPQNCKKGKLHPSTDKHSLDLLRGHHPIVSVIKEHRTLAKLLNSTVGSICSRARLCMKSQKYTIQGHWLQTSTATGRLSMEEPNLQCVEHLVVFNTQRLDRNNSSSPDMDCNKINARDFFVPTQDNWLLLTADYSQIELRIMAHFSKDSSLIELLSKPDGDVFTMLAATWMGKLEPTISYQERDQTKRLVYGILYGMGANSLAEQLECSSEDAAEKIQSFKSSFPGVNSWLHEAVASCRHKGYVETLMGRRRYLSKIMLGNNKEKAKAQRQSVNSICQGSAADIIKIAMINVHSIIDGIEDFNSNTGLGTRFSMLKGHCRILLQVHDELVLEVDSNFKREGGMLLKICMESAASLLVPLIAKLKVGKTWGSLEPFQPEP